MIALHRGLIGTAGVLLLPLLSSCANYTGIDYGMSQEEVDAFSEQLMRGTSGGVRSTSSASPAEQAGAASAPELLPIAINEQFSFRLNCTAGGAIEVSGNLIGNIDVNGTGVLILDARETITDWRCAGSKVINGDPYLSLSSTFSFQNGQLGSQAYIRIGGGFKWGTKASDSCHILLSFQYNQDGTGRGTGTVCKRSVDISI